MSTFQHYYEEILRFRCSRCQVQIQELPLQEVLDDLCDSCFNTWLHTVWLKKLVKEYPAIAVPEHLRLDDGL